MIIRARVAPAHRQQLALDAAPNPRDRRHREELTLERQHHDDHQGSSLTGARRTPATSPNLRTSGPRTSPASPPPLEPRLELLQTGMEENEGEGEARPGVRKKKEHRDRFSSGLVYGGRSPPASLVARSPVFGGESASSADSALAREVSARCTGS